MEFKKLKNYIVTSVKGCGLFNHIADLLLSPLRVVVGGNTYEIVRNDEGNILSFEHIEPRGIFRIVKYCFVFGIMFVPLVIPLILIVGMPLIITGIVFKILAWNKKNVRKNYSIIYDYVNK